MDRSLKNKPGRSIIQIANALRIPHVYLPSIKFTKVRRTRNSRMIEDKIAFLYVFRRSLLSLSLSILYHFSAGLNFMM